MFTFCPAAPAVAPRLQQCSSCQQRLPRSSFTPSQLSKGAHRRCGLCVGGTPSVPPGPPSPSSVPPEPPSPSSETSSLSLDEMVASARAAAAGFADPQCAASASDDAVAAGSPSPAVGSGRQRRRARRPSQLQQVRWLPALEVGPERLRRIGAAAEGQITGGRVSQQWDGPLPPCVQEAADYAAGLAVAGGGRWLPSSARESAFNACGIVWHDYYECVQCGVWAIINGDHHDALFSDAQHQSILDVGDAFVRHQLERIPHNHCVLQLFPAVACGVVDLLAAGVCDDSDLPERWSHLRRSREVLSDRRRLEHMQSLSSARRALAALPPPGSRVPAVRWAAECAAEVRLFALRPPEMLAFGRACLHDCDAVPEVDLEPAALSAGDVRAAEAAALDAGREAIRRLGLASVAPASASSALAVPPSLPAPVTASPTATALPPAPVVPAAAMAVGLPAGRRWRRARRPVCAASPVTTTTPSPASPPAPASVVSREASPSGCEDYDDYDDYDDIHDDFTGDDELDAVEDGFAALAAADVL